MKLTKIVALTVLLLTIGTANAEKYRITVPVTPDQNQRAMLLINYDTAETIDSLPVAGEKVEFVGEIDEPVPAVLKFAGDKYPFVQFVLEGGSMAFRPESASPIGAVMVGTMLNDARNEFNASVMPLIQEFRSSASAERKEELYNEYMVKSDSLMLANIDNPIGYYKFLEVSSDMQPDMVLMTLQLHPSLGAYKRVAKIKESIEAKTLTQPGMPFRDFEVTYNGKTERLSDYVGKGKYVLVDYWASWCGPCIRQTAVLKDLYNQYKDQGLEVLGVAVWDDPEDTLEAIEQHQLPWPSIIDAQRIPTDLYGIAGIPCIILYGPDGTILSRDKQDDELRADVAKYMQQQ